MRGDNDALLFQAVALLMMVITLSPVAGLSLGWAWRVFAWASGLG